MADDFSTKDAFDFFQKIWNPLPFPMQAMMPPLKPEEVDKKINELKTVESWLTMNLGFVQMTIKTLELQKATLNAFHAGQASVEANRNPAADLSAAAVMAAAEQLKHVPWPWNMLNPDKANTEAAPPSPATADKASRHSKKGA